MELRLRGRSRTCTLRLRILYHPLDNYATRVYHNNEATLQQRGGDCVTNPETDLIGASDAARLLGVERSTIKRYEERGRLVPVQIHYEGLRRKPLFRRADVEALRPADPSTNV